MKKTKPSKIDERELASFCASVGSCITCNGTQLLCGRCGNAQNACRCGGAEEGNLMECPDCAPPKFSLTVFQCEQVIGIKAKRWPMRCHEIANLILAAGLVPRGESRYGGYLGPIAKDSPFAKRAFARHGWIEVPDGDRHGSGYIVDPTRWVFEARDPYIAVIGANSRQFDEYDIGHASISGRNDREPPQDGDLLGAVDGRGRHVQVKWPKSVHGFLIQRFGRHCDLLLGQVHWLASRSPDTLGIHAKSIYKTIREAGLGGFIPIDYQQVVFKDRY